MPSPQPEAAMQETALIPDDRDRIKHLGEVEWTRALESGDVEQLLRLCADDIVYMPADHPVLHGHAELRQWLSTFPKIVRMSQPMHSIEIAGNVAMAEATFDATLDVDGQRMAATGKAMCRLRKNAAGQWQVKTVCWNFDQPVGPAPSPR
jgi:ketosteroid isomerase-like protein